MDNDQHSTTRQMRKRKCSDATGESLDIEDQDSDRRSSEGLEETVLQVAKETRSKKNHTKKKKKKKRSLDERPKTPSSKNMAKSSSSSKKDSSKQKSYSDIPSHHKSPRINSNSEKNKSKKQKHKTPCSDMVSKVYYTRSKSNSSRDSIDEPRKSVASSPVSSTKSSGTVSTITPSISAERVENETIKSPTGLLLTVERNQVQKRKRSAAPTLLSPGHIRFQSSESELSSDDDSDVDNEKQTSEQLPEEYMDSVQLSTDEALKVEGRDQQPAQNGGSVQSPDLTPSEKSNHGSQSFHNNNGQFKRQNSSSPHQIGCTSRGSGSDSWHWGQGNWDKNSQLSTTQSNKAFIIEVR